MTQHILVVEYEPRYIQRIEEAATISGFSITVARTGDEAIQALPGVRYDLIVLSTIIPRYNTAQLIRSIRGDSINESTPILLTTSGYSGSDPRSDARKIGASDMLIKPYAPANFVQKVKSVLNLPEEDRAPDIEQGAETVRLSSKEIFGDLIDQSPRGEQSVSSEPGETAPDETVTVQKISSPADDDSTSPAQESVQKRRRSAADDVDQMLADTLAGVRLPSPKKKRKDTAAEDLEKMLENTLSGLETSRTREPKPAEDESAKRDGAEEPEQDVLGTGLKNEPFASSAAPAVPPKPAGEGVSDDFEEDPFPEMPDASAEPEQDEAPFEGVGERADEQPAPGTTLIGGEEPPPRVQSPEPGLAEDSGHFGQYVLLEKIATGGMAEVWKARMRGLEGFEKIVAIKKILPHLSDNDEFIDMFVDEAKLAAQLSHNNIIHIYDLGKIDGSWFIAMEYNDGYDLKSLMARGREAKRPLPIPLSLFIASKVASALDYAHRKKGFDEQELGVVHRDVSPQNVLISREGDIKICDFGIAKAATKASHTQAGSLKGKLQYMSPEQAWGRHVDHRSDIFATAAVLFEMIAGRKLFSGDSELSVLDQVREARVPLPSTYNPEVSAEIDDVVLKGLEKDPAARFRTAGEMARAIDAILSNYKPAPSSSDLASYIETIEEPENHPMPAIAAAQSSARTAPPVEPEEEPPVKAEPVETPLPVPAPVPAATTEPSTPAVEPSGRTSVTAPPEPDIEEKRPEPQAPMFGATVGSERPAKKRRAFPIAIALLVILATVAAGAVVMMRQNAETGGPQSDVSAALGANPPAGAADSRAVVEAPPAETTAEDVVSPEALEEELLATAASGELGEEDLALIEQAVRDRIAAERRRLEAQRQEQSQPPPPRTQPERRETAADPSPPVSRSPQPTPPPAAPTSQPAEQPSTPSAETPPATTTTAVSQPPAPAEQAPAQPTKPAVRRGDLVEPGTPGLTEPQIIELEKVSYPLLARRNKVEGLIIVRALISEEGKVLEAELLRGVSQNVGLNEAAIEMVRGGKFQAGRMGNVPVRTWKTIPIPFRIQ